MRSTSETGCSGAIVALLARVPANAVGSASW